MLCPSFIEESADAGAFVDEPEHEFIHDKKSLFKRISMKRLAGAPRRWRTQLERGPAGTWAFTG